MVVTDAGSASFHRLAETIKRIFGIANVLPVHQGRVAERLLVETVIGKGGSPGRGMLVPNNAHFDTTRAMIEASGAETVNLLCAGGDDPVNPSPPEPLHLRTANNPHETRRRSAVSRRRSNRRAIRTSRSKSGFRRQAGTASSRPSAMVRSTDRSPIRRSRPHSRAATRPVRPTPATREIPRALRRDILKK